MTVGVILSGKKIQAKSPLRVHFLRSLAVGGFLSSVLFFSACSEAGPEAPSETQVAPKAGPAAESEESPADSAGETTRGGPEFPAAVPDPIQIRSRPTQADPPDQP